LDLFSITMKLLIIFQYYTVGNIGNFAPHCVQNLVVVEGRSALQLLQLPKPSELLFDTVTFLFSEHETQIIPSTLFLN